MEVVCSERVDGEDDVVNVMANALRCSRARISVDDRPMVLFFFLFFFFFQAEDGIRDHCVTGVQTCALPISSRRKLLPGEYWRHGRYREHDHGDLDSRWKIQGLDEEGGNERHDNQHRDRRLKKPFGVSKKIRGVLSRGLKTETENDHHDARPEHELNHSCQIHLKSPAV